MIETLHGTHETVNYRENTGLKIYDNKETEDYPTHWHSPIEILVPVKNDYKVTYNDTDITLSVGDILIICPGVLHHLYPSPGRRWIIQAEVSTLRDVDAVLSLISPALLINRETFPEDYDKIRSLVDSITEEYTNSLSFYEAAVYGLLLNLFVIIGRSLEITSRRIAMDDSRQKKYVEKFMAVCAYIDEHSAEDLTLDDVAAYSGFSKYHFTRLFRQFTGTTFYRYLNQKRIAKAEQMLTDPECSITDAALSSGFTSMSAFIRMFRIMKGCTPSQFRKMYSP